MPTWAVAISIVATSLSAVTFIGVPNSAYGGDLTYLATNLGMILAALVIAYFFIPVFYRSQSASIYDLLERRFDARARKAASVTFLIGRILASGVRVYVGAMPASVLLFGVEHGSSPATSPPPSPCSRSSALSTPSPAGSVLSSGPMSSNTSCSWARRSPRSS